MLANRRAILPEMTLPAAAVSRLLRDELGRRILRELELAAAYPGIVGFDPHSNFPYSTVQAGSTIIGSTATPRTVALATGNGASFPGGDGTTQFNVVLWPPGTRPLASNAEIARVTRSGDVLTTTARGQEGTAALGTIAAGWQVMAAVTAKTLTDVEDLSVVAVTVAGLGTGFAGKHGLIRVGSTPFSFVALVYDSTLAKWVSEPVLWLVPVEVAGGAVTDTLWVTGSNEHVPTSMQIRDYKALYDAGLRLQAFCQGRGSSVAGAWNYKLRASDFDDGDTALATIATSAAIVSGSAANEYRGGWVDFVATPTQAHVQLDPLYTIPAAGNMGETSRGIVFGYRWVG